MMQPKVSVIIPVYNVEQYLRECLDSVVGQTLKEIEIVCVNDGSPDNSELILREYAQRDPRVVALKKKNGGLSSARNYGAAHAAGKYIYFLDSDDYIREDALELLYNTAEENQTDIIFFGGDSFFEKESLVETHGTYLNYYHREKLADGPVSGVTMLRLFVEKGLFRSSVPLQFIDRAFLERTGIRFPEDIVHEDELFTPRLMLESERVMCITENLYFRRLHENSIMTGGALVRKFNGQFTVFAKLLGVYLDREWESDEDGTALLSRVKSLYSASRRTYESMSAQDRSLVLQDHLSGYQFLYQEINYSKWIKTEQMLKELRKSTASAKTMTAAAARGSAIDREAELELLRTRVVYLDDEIRGIRSSVTYRVGRVITFVPRKARGLVRCYRENGWSYTVCRILQKLGLGFLLKKRAKVVNNKRNVQKKALQAQPEGTAVSVIVPVYNAQEHLAQCIDSILAQTMRSFELICVDDGSTDRSVDIIREYQSRDKRVKLLQQKNLYAGIARNHGMETAEGKYLLFLDADDFFEPDMLASMYAQAEKDQADVCVCAADRYHTEKKTYEKAPWLLNVRFLPENRPFSRHDCLRNIFQISSPAPWTKLFRKEFVRQQKLQFQGLQRSNDLYFTFSAIALAERITVVEKELVHYRVGQANNLQSKNNLTPMLFCQALSALKQELVRNGIWNEVSGSFSDLSLNTSVYNIKTLSGEPRTAVLEAFRDRYVEEFEFLRYERDFYGLKANYDYLLEALAEVDS